MGPMMSWKEGSTAARLACFRASLSSEESSDISRFRISCITWRRVSSEGAGQIDRIGSYSWAARAIIRARLTLALIETHS